MLEWKNKMLKRQRYSMSQASCESNKPIQSVQQSRIQQVIDHMIVYIKKLISKLVRVKNTQNVNLLKNGVSDYQLYQPTNFQIPEDLSLRQQMKIIQIIYRKTNNLLKNFDQLQHLGQELNQVFHICKDSPQSSASSFFSMFCDRISNQTKKIKKQRLKIVTPQNSIINTSSIKQKLMFRNTSDLLKQTIYDILDIQKVQACFYFIQGVKTMDNLLYVYQKIKGRNKKIKNQINEYANMYNERQKQNDKQMQKMKTYENQNRQKEEKYKQVKRQSLFQTRARLGSASKNKRSSNNLSIKDFRVSQKKTQEKTKESRQNSVKSKLKPLNINKQKLKLKLIR